MKERFENRLYPDKGGHKERGQFHQGVRQIQKVFSLPEEIAFQIRRDMLRPSRDGKS